MNFKKITATAMAEGTGARVWRLFPGASINSLDPFVLLDEFSVEPGAGFPEHPHRGFEAVTYMLNGSFRHVDNLGNDTTVEQGGVQRFSAGKGIRHSEMPGGNQGCHGFQLWINLPANLKKSDPQYQQVNSANIKQENFDNGVMRTIIGDNSPVKHFTPVFYQDIHFLQPGSKVLQFPPEYQCLIYVYQNDLNAEDFILQKHEALLFSGKIEIMVKAQSACQFITLAGKPLQQPIVIKGSFVE